MSELTEDDRRKLEMYRTLFEDSDLSLRTYYRERRNCTNFIQELREAGYTIPDIYDLMYQKLVHGGLVSQT